MNISKILLFPFLLLQNLNVAEEVLVWTEQAASAFGRYCLTWQRWYQLEATKSQPMKNYKKNFFLYDWTNKIALTVEAQVPNI